jgi:hypothetical protein
LHAALGTTAPPWTPLFATAAAVVSDTDGILSHCAVVAREYGIPAVVGTGNATSRITDGQLIEVDGDAEIVRLLPCTMSFVREPGCFCPSSWPSSQHSPRVGRRTGAQPSQHGVRVANGPCRFEGRNRQDPPTPTPDKT